MAGIWTEERVKAAQTLFNVGRSATESAAILSADFGFKVSRGAVIGLWWRRKWKNPEKQGTQSKKYSGAEVRKVVRIRPHGSATALKVIEKAERVIPLELRLAIVEPKHITLFELKQDACRYPYGDGPFTFCGCQSSPGSPYCAPHRDLCGSVYVKMNESERRSAAQKRAFAARQAKKTEAA